MKKKLKQISYISAIIFIVGSTIGVGIFVKNKSLIKMAQGDLIFVLSSWIIAAFGMICIGMALIEVSSAQKTNRGTLEWTKIFTKEWFHKGTVNYIKYIFIPISLFTMPIYVVYQLQDSGLFFGKKHSAIIALIIAYSIFLCFFVINLISLKYGEKAQWLFTIVKAVPIIALTIIAFINYGDVGANNTVLKKEIPSDEQLKGLEGISKYIILIGGIPGISFAYDGFYNITSLKTNMKNEKKLGSALIIGIICITFAYLVLTLSFNVGSEDGTHEGIATLKNNSNLKSLFNSLIAIGILGIVNGYCMSSTPQFVDLIETNEGKEFQWLQKKIYHKEFNEKSHKQKFFASWLAIFIFTSLFFLVFGLIGSYVYTDATNGSKDFYGTSAYLYAFTDILVNYTSLIIFFVIATVILGCLINRKTKQVKVKRVNFFIFCSIFAIIIFYAATLFLIVEAIMGMASFNDADSESSIIKFIILIIILNVSYTPYFIKKFYHKIKNHFSKKNEKINVLNDK